MSNVVKPLKPEVLYTACPKSQLNFKTTKDLKPQDNVIGQARAVESIRFAIGMCHDGYNLFAFGPEGTGKSSTVLRFLQREAKTQKTQSDWCYVNNFEDPHKPRAVELPPGKACPLRDDMERLVEELQGALPAAFESEDYGQRKEALEEELKTRHEGAFSKLQKRAEDNGIALVRTPMGLGLAPVQDGEVLTPQAFEKLSEEEQKSRQAALTELQAQLEDILAQIPKWEKEHREKLRELNRDVTQRAVGHLIEELEKRWHDHANVMTYLEAVRQDVIDHAADFLPSADQSQQLVTIPGQRSASGGAGSFRRYQVNVIVDNSACEDDPEVGAPVVEEEHPTQPNLVGRVEHLSQMGTLVTDFNLIKAGALHRANGGYLVLDARRVLMQPFAWETLKRALRGRHIRIESPAESLGWATTVSLEPEPIPLNVKVVMLGEPMIYYLLSMYDPDFKELFKVAADFANTMDRDESGVKEYAALLASQVEREGLRHLDQGAVARIIEQGARIAGDTEKLTTHMASVVDLVREADYWAGVENKKIISARHVQEAIDAKIYRSDRYRERLQEEIQRGTFVIETNGAKVGQINGLSVLQLDTFAFGRPSRITVNVSLGKGELVDIERQVELGGPLHSKGVMILESFLNARFGQDGPLALSARIVFEQSYGGIDGDSASSTELYALMSAIAGIPIKQSIAVTGSVDQQGRVQAIGGVNDKIEGFFDICAARGLTGEQGVIIPATNVKHLMLRHDVVEAVKAGQFNIWAVDTIDQGIEILTGVPAGELAENGTYPIGSVNRAVARVLRQFGAKVRAFSAGAPQAPTNAIIKVEQRRDA
ncbi:Lon protease family protein [Magnetovibrio sp.]|uniref:Lon protease family protein n=1 Tax=Magnetovibrio sp. TaxID=2024836 RepID=UPI002F91E985